MTERAEREDRRTGWLLANIEAVPE